MKLNTRPNSWTLFLIMLLAAAVVGEGALVRAAHGRRTSPLTNPQARVAWLKVAAQIHGTGPADYNAVANARSAASVV